MEDLFRIGKTIRDRRLELNLRMDDVAKRANTTRATLWAIEKGSANCSVKTLLQVMAVLGLKMSVNYPDSTASSRNRASRINTVLAKKKNRFLVMCIMQYASSIGLSNEEVYEKMQQPGLLDEIEDDYEDLHGMSSICLNDYIGARLGYKCQKQNDKSMNHASAKTIIITKVIELIAEKYHLSLKEARDLFFRSDVIKLIEDDETGLYGESPLYSFSIFEQKYKRKNQQRGV